MPLANETLKNQLTRFADLCDRMYYNRHNKFEDKVLIELETCLRNAAKFVPDAVSALTGEIPLFAIKMVGDDNMYIHREDMTGTGLSHDIGRWPLVEAEQHVKAIMEVYPKATLAIIPVSEIVR